MNDPSNSQPPQRFMWAASACVAVLLILHLIGGRGELVLLRRVGAVVLLLSAPLMLIPLFLVKAGGTDRIVDQGLYAAVRHPQYLGYMGLAWGFSLLAQRELTYALALAATVLFVLQSLAEERWMIFRLGDSYRDYCRRVPRFNPLGRRRKREVT